MTEPAWHTFACRIRWSDVDAYGHVNNVKYFEYFQEARINFLYDVARVGQGSEAMVVARLVVDYKRPIYYRPEPYLIRTQVVRRGTSSYELSSQIVEGAGSPGEAGGAVAPASAGAGGAVGETVFASARAVLVAFDAEARASRPLTVEECAKLDQLIGG